MNTNHAEKGFQYNIKTNEKKSIKLENVTHRQ